MTDKSIKDNLVKWFWPSEDEVDSILGLLLEIKLIDKNKREINPRNLSISQWDSLPLDVGN